MILTKQLLEEKSAAFRAQHEGCVADSFRLEGALKCLAILLEELAKPEAAPVPQKPQLVPVGTADSGSQTFESSTVQ